MEIEAPESGTLLHIKVKEGEGVPPGTPICYIGENGEEVREKEALLLKKQGNRKLNLNIFPLQKPGKSVNTA